MKLEITRDSGRKRKGEGGGGGRYGVTGGKWMARGKLVAVENTLLSPPTPLLSGREDASVFFRHPISMALCYGPLTSRRCVFWIRFD